MRIAGLHAPCIQPGTLEQCTAAVAAAMKNPRIDIISHPDDGQFPLDYAYLVQLSKEQRTLLEVNNNSLNPVVPRRNTRSNCLKMLALCKKYQTPVIIGSDAHVDADVARCDFAMDVLREMCIRDSSRSALDICTRSGIQ